MSEISDQQLNELLTNRAATYAFLARIYLSEADEELLQIIAGLEVEVGQADSKISQAYQRLKTYVDSRHEGTLTELAVDYARLFLGAQRGDGAYPFESIYTSEDHLLMQEARDQVLALYRQEGLDRAKDFHDPEDHVGLEMEFMAFLSQKAQGQLAQDSLQDALALLEKQLQFLKAHLLNWMPAFCKDVHRIAETEFYRAASDLTLSYLAAEEDLLPNLIDSLRG